MSNPVIEAPEAGPAVTWQEGELLARRASSVRKAKRLALLAAGWVAMLLVWQLAAYYLPPGVLPTPLEVVAVMWEIVVSGAFVENFWGSVSKTFLGFLVAIVVGANDVVNPAALQNGSAIYGMPILDAYKAKTIIVNKRSMAAGYAGLDNELFYMDKTMMVFGDAKKVVEDMVKAVE